MPKHVTMTEVARKAGVSLMTVSRVVNNKDDVSPATRQRVLAVIEQLDYRPSSIARGLVTKHTGTLGLVVPDIANPFFASVVRSAEQQAYAMDYSVFLGNTNEDPQREMAILQSLEDKQIDGLLLCSSRLGDEEIRKMVTRYPAAVLVFRWLEDECVGTVLIDDLAGGKIATQHLLKTGHQKIGVISGPLVSHATHGRIAGYRAALSTEGIPYNPGWVRHCYPAVESGKSAAKKLLTSCSDLTALFCHNDLVAVGAILACAELNLRVPNDIAIVGFDDIPMAALVTPSLTTCRINKQKLGKQAMRLLLDQIADCPDDHPQLIYKPELIVRSSAPAN